MRKGVQLFFASFVIFLGINIQSTAVGQQQTSIELQWLSDSPPATPSGVSWGVPWQEGEVSKDAEFTLQTADGRDLPVQTWPTAYWPDGSVKWSGLATVADSQAAGPLTLSFAKGQNKDQSLQQDVQINVEESSNAIRINTGVMNAYLPKRGVDLIDSLIIDGSRVAGPAHLVAIHQAGPGGDMLNPPKRTKMASRIDSVSIEQDGPVRAVVRYDGIHKAVEGDREWLPFTVRLYFYADRKPIKMVHSVMYDGNQERDFIKGLGVQFEVPMREQVHNRHVRFSGKEDGLWAEPVKPLESRRQITYQDEAVYADQEQGRRVPDLEEYDPPIRGLINDLADWNSYKLVQESPDGFTIKKRTNPQSAWISAGAGSRASGLAFVGDVSGGLGVGLKNFWQTYPSHLEINGATKDTARLNVWMWSPEAEAAPLRYRSPRAGRQLRGCTGGLQ